MNKTTYALSFIIAGILITPSFAANPLQMLSNQAKSKVTSASASKLKAENFTDFSGTWTGSCGMGDPETTMKIENTDTSFSADGWELQIGALESHTTSSSTYSFSNQIILDWNADHSVLLANITNVDYSYASADKSHFLGKGSISLNNGQMIWEMALSGEEGTTSQHMTCTYKKQ